MTGLDRLQTLASFPNSAEAYAFAVDNPVLLWPERWPEIEAWIASVPSAERERFSAAMHAIRSLGEAVAANPGALWAENGPIERLALRVESSEIGLSRALSVAAEPEVSGALSPSYVRAVANRFFQRACSNESRAALLRFRLLLAATDAETAFVMDGGLRFGLVERWMGVVSMACHDVPDGRTFADAVGRGRAVAEAAEATGGTADAAQMRHDLGVLHLDPYFAGRPSAGITEQLRTWQERLGDEVGPVALADESRRMPDPIVALNVAIDEFGRSLAMRPGGSGRGLTLKVLAESILWLKTLGASADLARARDAAQEALTLLDPKEDATEVATLHGVLTALGEEGIATTPPEGDLTWSEAMAPLDESPPVDGAEFRAIQERARAIMDDQPLRAVRMLRSVAPLVVGDERDERRRWHANLFALAFRRHFGSSEALAAIEGDVDRMAADIRARASAESWARSEWAAALVGLSLAASENDGDEAALPFLQEAVGLFDDPSLVEQARVWTVTTTIGAAVDAFDRGDMGGATAHYARAAGMSVDLGMRDTALDEIDHARDTALRGDNHVYAPFLICLARLGPRLAAESPAGVSERLQQHWQALIAHIFQSPPVLVGPLWLALQAAKGGAFAAMLRNGVSYDPRNDPTAVSLLARIEAVRPPVSNEELIPDETALDDELVLAASGGSAVHADDVLANLEQAFDRRLTQGLIGTGSPLDALISLEAIQGRLDDRTVLMVPYVGKNAGGQLAVTTLLVTREGTAGALGVSDLPSARIIMGDDDRQVWADWIGPTVADLRRRIVEDPGPASIVPEGAEILADDFRTYLGGGLAERLAEFRAAGKDHLCVHPHGPLHFYPWPLVGLEDRPLAEDWIVTTVPHPGLLERSGEPLATEGKLPMASLGLSFSGGRPFRLPPLDGSVAEAQAVAKALGGTAWVEKEATERRFVEALEGASRVHLSTHGRQRVAAPAFQRVYLAPDDASEGVFYAQEALGLDLRHVDLITLSACETALGRIDANDVPRGLPAMLFLAGARTIVGCLWPVAADVARFFFETMSMQIALGEGKLDAFRAAQQTTRAAFPSYRDWGAFNYAGLW